MHPDFFTKKVNTFLHYGNTNDNHPTNEDERGAE